MGQHHSSDRTRQQLDEHSRLLADILSSQSNLQGLLQLRNSTDEQGRLLAARTITDHPEDPLSSIVRVRPVVNKAGCMPISRTASTLL